MAPDSLVFMRRSVAVFLLAAVTLAPAVAAELFDGKKPQTPAQGAPIAAGNTIGGYPMYHGAKDWVMGSSRVSDANNFGVYYGSVAMFQMVGNEIGAHLVTTANLNQSAMPYYLAGDYCGGEHLVRVNRSESGRGDSAWDNCMTMDPHVARVPGGTLTLLRMVVTISQTGSRLYQMEMLLNPAVLGYPGSTEEDWTATAVNADPQRRQFIDGIAKWGRQMQDAARNAIEWRKPKDAFLAVADWRTLALPEQRAALVSGTRVSPPPVVQQALPDAMPAAVGPGLRPGDSLRFVDRDAISEAVTGETRLTIDRISGDETQLNGGAIVLRRDGTFRTGLPSGTYLHGFGAAGTARSATLHIGGYHQEAAVELQPAGNDAMVISGVTVPVSRYAISGRATDEVKFGAYETSLPRLGATFAGDVMVDNATGLVVMLRIRSQHIDYNIHRELVEIMR
jgi:hypothetical protein